MDEIMGRLRGNGEAHKVGMQVRVQDIGWLSWRQGERQSSNALRVSIP